MLDDWHLSNGTGFEAVRHHRRAPTSAPTLLRDAFGRNHIPIGYYPADSEAGRRMLAGLGLEDPELPVLVLEFTAPPTDAREPHPTSRSPTPSG